MNTKELLKTYESPSSICIRLDMAGIVCGSGTPGDDIPTDPSEPIIDLGIYDDHLFDVSDELLY